MVNSIKSFFKSTKTPQPTFPSSRAFLIFPIMLIKAWDVEYCCLNSKCRLQITLFSLRRVYNLLYIGDWAMVAIIYVWIQGDLAMVAIIYVWIFFKNQELLLQFWVQKEKQQSLKRGWINLPMASRFHFLEEMIFSKVYYLGQKAYWSWEYVSYFFFISRLQKYCTTSFIWKIVWKMFMWIFYAFFVLSAIEAK